MRFSVGYTKRTLPIHELLTQRVPAVFSVCAECSVALNTAGIHLEGSHAACISPLPKLRKKP